MCTCAVAVTDAIIATAIAIASSFANLLSSLFLPVLVPKPGVLQSPWNGRCVALLAGHYLECKTVASRNAFLRSEMNAPVMNTGDMDSYAIRRSPWCDRLLSGEGSLSAEIWSGTKVAKSSFRHGANFQDV